MMTIVRTRDYRRLAEFALPLLVALAIFVPVTAYQSATSTDYPTHNRFAAEIYLSGKVPLPHFMYQLFVLATRAVLNVKFSSAGFIVTLICQVITFFIIWWIIRRAVEKHTVIVPLVTAVSLVLMAPINFLTWNEHRLYLGYISPNVYHNPTMLVLKPLALALFLLTLKAFEKNETRLLRTLLVTALLVIVSSLTKPNFTIDLLPALAVAAAYYVVRRCPVNWRLVILGIFLPAGFVLASQYAFTYTNPDHAQIIFAPFKVMGLFTDQILRNFFLSILFPLAVYGLYFKDAIRNTTLNFAWVVFGFGAFFTYFFAEYDPSNDWRTLAGNFTWSGQVALFILLIVTAAFFLRHLLTPRNPEQSVPSSRVKAAICIAIFALHLISGVVWYYTQTVGPRPSYWW